MSLIITNPKIVTFCNINKSFDVDKFLLLAIDLIEPFLKPPDYDVYDIEKKMENNFEKIEGKLSALFDEKINQMIRDTFVGENSISKVLVDTVSNTSNPIIVAKLSDISANQVHGNLKLNELEKKIQTVANEPTNPAIHAQLAHISNNQTCTHSKITNLEKIVYDSNHSPSVIITSKLNDIYSNQQNTNNRINDLEKTVINVKNTPDLAISSKLNEISTCQQNYNYKFSELDQKISNMDNNLNGYLEKMKIQKGIVTERKFELLLEQALPGFIIDKVPSMNQRGRMDLNIKKQNKPDILIDLKDYSNTVPLTEILKFENDIIVSSNHGILVSPYSNISGKINFQLSIINGKIAIYLSNIGLDASDIVKSIQVIHFLHDFLSEKEDGIHLSKAMIDVVNNTINENAVRISNIKTHLTLAIGECNNIMFDTIKNLLSLKSETIFQCQKCDRIFENSRSLGSHKRYCK
jgi:hypothetical protein